MGSGLNSGSVCLNRGRARAGRRREFFQCLLLFLLGLVSFGHVDDEDAEIRSHDFNFDIKPPHINVQFDDSGGDQVVKRIEDLVLDVSHVVPAAEKYDDNNVAAEAVGYERPEIKDLE